MLKKVDDPGKGEVDISESGDVIQNSAILSYLSLITKLCHSEKFLKIIVFCLSF